MAGFIRWTSIIHSNFRNLCRQIRIHIKPFGKELVLAVELTITYVDGTVEVIHADEDFLVKEHPVVMSNVYGSETIDGRKNQDGWCTAGFNATSWENASIVTKEKEPTGRMIDQIQPPVKVLHSYQGEYLNNVQSKDIYDFTQKHVRNFRV